MGIWDHDHYVVKQKVLAIGRKYFIEDGAGRRIGFCHQKAFKLKEDIRIYTDEDMKQELLTIRQEQILDFSGTFAVSDPRTGETVGFVGRKALQSIIRDTWKIFDRNRNEIAMVQEESGFLAVMRRFFSIVRLVPKTYEFMAGNAIIAIAKQKFQIIGDTWNLYVQPGNPVDKRLIVTAALMMDIIEQQRGG